MANDLQDPIGAQLLAGKRVRRKLPPWGRLYIERTVPFLCVYRRPAARAIPEAESLIRSEAAYVYAAAPSGSDSDAPLDAAIKEAAGALQAAYGACLLLEVWVAPLGAKTGDAPASPGFRVLRGGRAPNASVVEVFEQRLRRIKLRGHPAEVDVEDSPCVTPPGLPPLLSEKAMKRRSFHHLGLEVAPCFVDPKSGLPAPVLLGRLRRQLYKALRWLFFEYSHEHAAGAAEKSAHAMGPRRLNRAALRADEGLEAVAQQLTFILQSTPVNLPALWRQWRRAEDVGKFIYRPLTIDPYRLKRELHNVPIEHLDDPTLYAIMRDKQLELDRKLTMLLDLGTQRYRQGSLQIYGGSHPGDLAAAKALLAAIPPRSRGPAGQGKALPAARVKKLAEAEIRHYRTQDPAFTATVELRTDIAAGLLCSRGNLLIDGTGEIPANRIEALLQHEVGTHLVTYYNGMAQPLRIFGRGLPGNVTLQEGLAVLSEFLAGGLNPPRLRVLAGRVVAVHTLLDGAELPETIHVLEGLHGFDKKTAFDVACRVHRGGGLTKDAVYLRGLRSLLDYLAQGKSLEPLLVGKISLAHAPIVDELLHRGVLLPPRFRPRYLDTSECSQRLEWLAKGVDVTDLLRYSPS